MKTLTPLAHSLRAIVALSENIIDDQNPLAAFPVTAVNEAGRAIRQTANGAMNQAVNHDALVAALENAANGYDLIAANCDRQSDDAKFGAWFKSVAKMARSGAEQARAAISR